MGNCARKYDVCAIPHTRPDSMEEQLCNDKLDVEDLEDSEPTRLINQKDNVNSTGGSPSQGLKAYNGHCSSLSIPFVKVMKPCSLQVDPMVVEVPTLKILKSPSANVNGNLVSCHNVNEAQGPGEIKALRKAASELQIYIVTWNMNGRLKKPVTNMSTLLDATGAKHDMYVVGLQEAPNFSGDGVISEVLGDKYFCVGASLMMSLQLYIFAKKSLRTYITGHLVDKVGVGGFGQVVGRQKGAATILLRYNKVSMLFITSHLAPHECNIMERNQQYDHICQTIFTRPTGFCSGCKDSKSTTVDEPHCKVRLGGNFVEDSDFVIWLGDLNYRVEMPRNYVGLLISHNLEEALWSKDQLQRAVQRGEVFKGFSEGPLLFPPTFKFDVGTDRYDTSAKERVPSWTDRILYKVKCSSPIKAKLLMYTSIDTVKTSDHRPVKALINLKNLLRTTSCTF